MKEIIKTLYGSKLIRLIIIPFLLLVLWLGLTFLYIIAFDTSLTVLSYIHPRDNFDKITNGRLYKGNVVSGSFVGQEDNLGILSVKFQTFIRPPYSLEDSLEFRLKERGSSKWYYESKYRDGLIYDVPLFPFGFPKIKNSRGKTYYFEIESLNGAGNNSVAISNKSQVLFSKYQVPKSLLLHNRREFVMFIFRKFISSMLTTDVRFSSVIYLLPFIFYLFWLSPFKKKLILPFIAFINDSIDNHSDQYSIKLLIPLLKFIKRLLLYELDFIIIFIILFDILVIQINNDVIYIVIIALWIITLKAYKLKSKYTFLIALMILSFAPLFLFLQSEPIAEKATIWAYIFLIAGTIQILMESKSSKKNGYEKN